MELYSIVDPVPTGISRLCLLEAIAKACLLLFHAVVPHLNGVILVNPQRRHLPPPVAKLGYG